MAFLTRSKPSSFPSSSILHHLLFSPFSTAAAATNTTVSLSPAETKLLGHFHALIKDHHRTNPDPSTPTTPPPDLTIPSLSSAFSHLSPQVPSTSLALYLIRLCASPRHSPPFSQTLSFFNWYLSTITTTTPSPSLTDPFVAMIDFAAKLRHFHVSWHLLDTLLSLSIPIPPRAFHSLIRRYVRAGLPSDAIDAFRRMPDYDLPSDDPIAFSALLAVLSKKRLASDAQSLFDTVAQRLRPDVVTYSALVHAWCRAGRLEEAERVFREMKEKDITPNVYTYTAVIDAMCRVGQIPRAHELLCHMIDAGCPPNSATFNSLMRAHVKAGRTEQVLQVHNQMKQLGCEPDLITYNFLIEAHCRAGQQNLDAALKVLNQMALKGCAPDAHSFNPIFRCIVSLGDVNAAHRMYERMRELKCQPNTVTYNLLMQLFSKEKSMDMVLRMKREMEEEGVEENVNTYGVLIAAFCGRGHWKRAYGLMREMVEGKCLKPSRPMYEMVSKAMKNAGQLRRHEELVEKLEERGFMTRPI